MWVSVLSYSNATVFIQLYDYTFISVLYVLIYCITMNEFILKYLNWCSGVHAPLHQAKKYFADPT